MFAKRRTRKISPARLEQRRKKILIFVGALFAAFAVCVALFSWMTHIDRFAISSVYVEGNKVIEAEGVRGIVEERLQGTYIKLFARENIFIYPRDDITASLYDAYSRIADVDVSRDGLTGVDVFIREYEPFALWCGNEKRTREENVQEQCYFFDDTGYVFDVAPDFSGDVFIKYYGDLATSSEPLRQSFLTPGNVDRVSDFLVLLETVAFEPLSFTVTPDRDYEISMRGDVSILLTEKSNLLESLENLQSVVESEKFVAAMSETEKRLEYIDMRFDNKIFYRFTEE